MKERQTDRKQERQKDRKEKESKATVLKSRWFWDLPTSIMIIAIKTTLLLFF